MPLHVDRSSSAPTRHPTRRRLWWKTRFVLDGTLESRPFVWVDDEIDAGARSALRALRRQRSLLLAPSAATGVGDEHLAAIERFAGTPVRCSR